MEYRFHEDERDAGPSGASTPVQAQALHGDEPGAVSDDQRAGENPDPGHG